MDNNKICARCHVEKSIDQFVKRKHGRPGSWCRECTNTYIKEKGYHKYSRRQEYFINWQRQFRQTDKGKEHEKRFRRPYELSFRGTVTSLLCAVRNRAKVNNLEIEIDRQWIEQHLQAMKCEASGVELVLEIDESVCHTPFRPSIDRIDNSKGYIKDNCRIVAVIYNKAKSDCSDEDVLKMAQALVQKSLVDVK